MLTVRHGSRPEEVRQSAKHTLFVEGEKSSAFDQQLLYELLQGIIAVKPMGPSFHVRSVAEALHEHHPHYYFLIDRDHYNDEFVESSWRNFPDTAQRNLLVWRRRELENYFLDPAYSCLSRWLRVSTDELRAVVRKSCQSRLFLDAANSVIVTIRETLKEQWITKFTRVTDFSSRKAALTKLNSVGEFRNHATKVKAVLSKGNVQALFDRAMNELSANRTTLEYGRGHWLELMEGSRVLPSVVARCFRVIDSQNRAVEGFEAVKEVAKSLVRRDLSEQPEDFRQLYQLIKMQVEK